MTLKRLDRRKFFLLSSATVLAGCGSLGGDVKPAEPEVPEGAIDPSATASTYSAITPNPRPTAQVGNALFRLVQGLPDNRLWSSGRHWNPQAKGLYVYISTSWAEGLQPTSYLPAVFNQGLPRIATKELDLALSAGAIKLASDIKNGRTQPNFSNVVTAVRSFARSGDMTPSIASLSPSTGPYRQLRNAALSSLAAEGARSRGFPSHEATMEKLRVSTFPNINGKMIVVNIAAYDLHAYKEGRPSLRSRVIVGKEARQTPVGPDSISNLKFSPDWTPPRSIINADLVPALQQDPTSLDILGIEIFVDGERIEDVHSYDWWNVNPNAVTMHQPPGPTAILGGVRFTMTNSQAIYLHDTSARPLFNQDLRTASSGCVRVERSKELSAWLLENDGQPMAAAEIDRRMKLVEPEFVRLNQPMRVEMLYFTSWINDKGVFTLYPDIYNRDTSLMNALYGT